MIEDAIISLESKFNDAIKSKHNETDTLLKQIQRQLSYHHLQPPPATPQEAFTTSSLASSCKVIHHVYPNAPSGYYWIKNSTGTPIQVYCKMDANCSGYTGGWMRVAYIDMRISSHQCPSGRSLRSQISNPRRVCDWLSYSPTGCPSTSFPVHGLRYRHVYGRIIAYQNSIPRAFSSTYNGIDRAYVYGVSLTHSQLFTCKHIWTFAGAADESSNNNTYKCPCINQNISPSSIRIPSFIGNDYFCDTAQSSYYGYGYTSGLYSSDPLWDSQGCGSSNTCCSVSNLCTNSPPWFIKHLPSATTDNVEMKFCRPYFHGSTPIELIELYVQ